MCVQLDRLLFYFKKNLVTKERMLRRNNIEGIRDNHHRESVPPATCVRLCKLKVKMC